VWGNLKHGKKPTMAQRKLMEDFDSRINSDNWLVVKDTPEEMIIVHRDNKHNKRIITKKSDNDRR
jgi:hypothetical protein